MKLAPLVLAFTISSAAFAETTLNANIPEEYRASLNKMALECDGDTVRGPCYLQLRAALAKIEADYFNRFIQGKVGGTPAYAAADAVRKKAFTGLTRAEILRRASELK